MKQWSMCFRVPLWTLLLASVLVGASAWAQSESPETGGDRGLVGGDRPWARGVSEDDREAARSLFKEANELLMQQYFKEAAVRYRAAMDHWDHPAIHYNLSLALMNLEQPVELYTALKKSLEHGVEPLIEQANYDRAEQLLKVVGQQIAHFEIICNEPKAQVAMDGRVLFIGPGHYRGVALAGEHLLVASKEGYLTENRRVVMSAGKETRIEFELYTMDALSYEERRFAAWMPWTVTGAGLAVVTLGAVFHQRAKSTYAEFDTKFDERCTTGCADSQVPDLSEDLSQADTQQRIGLAAYAVGGATMATGLVLVILNRPKLIRRARPDAGQNISIEPVFGSGTTGISATFRF